MFVASISTDDKNEHSFEWTHSTQCVVHTESYPRNTERVICAYSKNLNEDIFIQILKNEDIFIQILMKMRMHMHKNANMMKYAKMQIWQDVCICKYFDLDPEGTRFFLKNNWNWNLDNV